MPRALALRARGVSSFDALDLDPSSVSEGDDCEIRDEDKKKKRPVSIR